MRAFGINNIYYEYILDVITDEIKDPTTPEWVNQVPTLDPKVWNKNLKTITVIMRLTDAQLYTLKKLQQNARFVFIFDNLHETYHYAWVSTIDEVMANTENVYYPWKVTVSFYSVYDKTLNYIGFEKRSLTVGFQDGFERRPLMTT